MSLKNIFISIIVLLLIASIPALTQTNDASKYPYASQEIRIEVENTIQKHLDKDHNFVGVNWIEDHEWNREIFSSKNQPLLVKTLKQLNIDSIRYPGGLNSTLNYWDVPYQDVLTGLRKLNKFEQAWLARSSLRKGDRLDFFDFLKFCKNNGFTATIQVNPHSIYDKTNNEIIFTKQHKYTTDNKRVFNSGKIDWNIVKKSAQYAAMQVKWVKENGYSDIVKYWEIGNEEWAFNHFLNVDFTGYEYSKVVETYINEMMKEDPSIKIIVSMVNSTEFKNSKDVYLSFRLTEWTKSFFANTNLVNLQKNIFGFNQHIYIGHPDLKPETNFADFENIVLNQPKFDVTPKLSSSDENLKSKGFTNPRIFLNEFNVNEFRNRFMHTWISALSLSKLILSASNSPNCYHSDYHSLFHFYKDASLGFGLVHFAKDFPENPFIPYASAYAVRFLNLNIKGSVLKAKFDPLKIYSTASIDNGKLRVIVLNLSKEGKSIKLDFTGFKELGYLGNKSLGVNIKPDFTTIPFDDSSQNPSEIRVINSLNNVIKVIKDKDGYSLLLPSYTMSVFEFSTCNT